MCQVKHLFNIRPRLYWTIPVALSGCIIIPPSSFDVSDVPAVSGPACEITVVRINAFWGSTWSHYVVLDGILIARIRNGQFTTFLVPEDSHDLALISPTQDVGGGGGAGGGILVITHDMQPTPPIPFFCHPPTPIYFGIWTNNSIDNYFTFEQIDKLEGEYDLRDKSYVAPGARH